VTGSSRNFGAAKHSHPFPEFTLCTDDGGTAGHAGTLVATQQCVNFLRGG